MIKKDVEEDAKHALKLISDNLIPRPVFSSRGAIYPFTTENLTGYYDYLDFNNKKVLTVASSGDHALNSILYGAKETYVFDINRLTKYYVDLKRAAIYNLNYEEYKKFFHVNYLYSTEFNKKNYDKIQRDLSIESKYFWNELYKKYPPEVIRDRLFFSQTYSHETMEEISPYLYESRYNKLKEKIGDKKINFIESNIIELPNKIKDYNYDLILLSNISDYIEEIYGDKEKNKSEKYKELILNLSKRLNDNGKIVFAYLYGCYITNKDFNYEKYLFHNIKYINELFGDSCIETIFFDGVRKPNKDAVMIKSIKHF